MLKIADRLPISCPGAMASNGCRMIRFVIILPIIVVTWLLLVKAVSDLKKANIDWTGVATIIGFIALAFWLRHITGMG
ncbi:conserved hypothetical protein [Mesorhizobium sp. ORS 3324]|nr:conserved hypothetical protein [Mesorhizobium sp. ORS 3324]